MALKPWDKFEYLMSSGREPNPDDAPYRPAPIPNPGKPPWPGYPNSPKLAGAGSRQIRDTLKPFTKGSGYDKEGGSLRGVPTPLRIQLLKDAMAKAPALNDIKKTWPWRTRPKEGTNYREFCDPLTGCSLQDFKA